MSGVCTALRSATNAQRACAFAGEFIGQVAQLCRRFPGEQARIAREVDKNLIVQVMHRHPAALTVEQLMTLLDRHTDRHVMLRLLCLIRNERTM